MPDEIVSQDVETVISEFNMGLIEGKHLLVAGGAGFLGSYLCDVFVRMGGNVTCVDNFSSGLPENLDDVRGMNNFRMIASSVENFNSEEKYDYILHFASRASPEDYQYFPVETLLANALGGRQMLELARKSEATVLFASTSEVYGDAKEVPTPETYWGNVNPIGVRSCYDEGKRFGEALFTAYVKSYGMDARIVRIFNTYGPRLRADGAYARALSRFVFQGLSGKDLTVYGDGSQTRSFSYVTDTIAGILSVLTSENARGEIFNIGNDHEVSIMFLAEKIREMLGLDLKVSFLPLPKDDPRRRCPDVTKARTRLSWKPKVNLEEGLKRTILWFRKRTNV